MNRGPPLVEAPDTASIGAPDRQTLRAIHRFLSGLSVVGATEIRPNQHEPMQVVSNIEGAPGSETTYRLEVMWYESGHFSIRCDGETTDGDRWHVQWDRHWNGEVRRAHFHPSAGGDIQDMTFEYGEPIDVVTKVVAVIQSL